MRLRSLLAAAVVVAATFTIIAPASAATDGWSDPIGDSTNPYADIDFVGGSYSESLITLGLSTDQVYNPSYWDDDTFIIFDLDTNLDGVRDVAVFYDNLGVDVYQTSGSTLGAHLCAGTQVFDSTGGVPFFAHFDASCIGRPASFRMRAFFKLFTGASDFAPSTAFSPAIARDNPSLPPPPPGPDPQVGPASGPTGPGYWMLADSGAISNFGGARKHGAGQFVLDPNVFPPFVDLEPTPSGNGYWTLEAGGAVRSYGDAAALPAGHALPAGDKYVSMSVTPDGAGLWLFTAKGQVITRGNAGFFGDMGATVLNAAVLDSVATPDGGGYWMVAADGGIFTFGNARFAGSTGAMKLNKPVVSMAADPDGTGYWLVASDGGIFAFDAAFFGSMGGTPLNKPVSGMVPGAAGYLMVAEDGGVFSFGNVGFYGSLGANPSPRPIVAIALKRNDTLVVPASEPISPSTTTTTQPPVTTPTSTTTTTTTTPTTTTTTTTTTTSTTTTTAPTTTTTTTTAPNPAAAAARSAVQAAGMNVFILDANNPDDALIFRAYLYRGWLPRSQEACGLIVDALIEAGYADLGWRVHLHHYDNNELLCDRAVSTVPTTTTSTSTSSTTTTTTAPQPVNCWDKNYYLQALNAAGLGGNVYAILSPTLSSTPARDQVVAIIMKSPTTGTTAQQVLDVAVAKRNSLNCGGSVPVIEVRYGSENPFLRG